MTTTARRTPPCNVAMEQMVLGAVLLDNEALEKAAEIITSSADFYNAKHRRVWDAMVEMLLRNAPTDMMTLAEELRKRGSFEEAGGIDYLAELIDSTPTAVNVVAHSKIIREKSLRRRLAQSSLDVYGRAMGDEEETAELLDAAQAGILELAFDTGGKKLVPVKDELGASLRHIETLYGRNTLTTGTPTGYRELDAMTAGLQKGDLIIIAGRPSMGKTTLAVNIAENLCLREDLDAVVAIFSLEMSSVSLVLRMLSSEARVSGSKLRNGFLAQSDWPKLTAAAGRIHATSIHIDDSSSVTALDVRSRARRLKAQKGRLDLVIVDYLQLMRSSERIENRVLEIADITRGLKALAKELDTPVIAVSQLARKTEDRVDKRPQLSDLRDSGAIEQDADVVMFVYREEFYAPKKPEAQGVADVIVGKQRNGPTGEVKLAFLKEFTRFENLEEGR